MPPTDDMDNSPDPGGHPGDAGGAPPDRATGRQDPLAAYRDVFAEAGNEQLEKALRDAMGVPHGDHALAQAIQVAEEFFERVATDEQREFLVEAGLSNDPQVLAFLSQAGEEFAAMERDLQDLEVENARLRSQLDAPGTLRSVKGASPRGESLAMTNASIDEQIELLWGEHGEALSNPNHRMHAAMQRKLERLQRARYGG